MLGENSYHYLVVKLMRINLIHTLTHGDYNGCQVTRMLLPQGNLSRWILLEVVTQELKTRTLYTWMLFNIFYDAFSAPILTRILIYLNTEVTLA